MDITAIISSKLGLFFILLFLSIITLLGYELWRDLREVLESNWVHVLLGGTPKHLNIKAVRKIQTRIQDTGNFKFVVLGDTQKTYKTLTRILEKAAGDNPDFIIHAGDFTSSGRFRQYMKIVRFIEHTKIPFICGIGNHDIQNHGLECFAHFFGPLNFYFDCGAYRFIFIDNCGKMIFPDFINLSEAHTQYKLLRGINNEQLDYLERALQGNSRNFIIMHVPPPVETYSHHSFKRNKERFISVMQQYSERIALVFSGHIHGYSKTCRDGVHYIVTGGAGEKLHARRDGIVNRFNYVLVEVANDSVTHTPQYIA